MSSENLALLKEEAKMVDAEVLMRQIQVLSELSNDIKYASQKRVLIEIALIKLCKPQMQSDVTSIVNRIDNLEKMMEDGIPMQMVSPSVAATGATPVTPIEKEPLPDAMPEEIEEMSRNWDRILGKLSPYLKAYVKEANNRTVNNQNQFVLIFDVPEGSESMAGDFASSAQSIAEIEQVIEEQIGKHVNVKVDINRTGVNSAKKYTDVIDYFANKGIDIQNENSQEELING